MATDCTVVQFTLSPCDLVLSTRRVLATVLTNVFFLPSHLLVPPASFQLLHVSRPSIFSLVVLFSSFHLRIPPSFFFPFHRITCPKNPSFLLSAVCGSVSSSSIPISKRKLSLVFFSVHDILCIFPHIHISHALIFFSFSLSLSTSHSHTGLSGKSVSSLSFFSWLCSRVCLSITFLIQSL